MRESARFAAVRSLAYGCALFGAETPAGLDLVVSFGIRAVVLPLMMRLPCEGVTPPVPEILVGREP
jgi:hypothetical protein